MAWHVAFVVAFVPGSALHTQASTEALREGAHAFAGHSTHAPSRSYSPAPHASHRSTPETFHGAAWCPGAQRQAAEPRAMPADGWLLALAGHATHAPAAPAAPIQK